MESYSSVSDDNPERNEDAEKEDMQVDYVLVFENFDETDGTSTEYRKLFEKMMRDDGLIVTYEYCKKKISFVKIHCPIDRLCLEAERVRLEMPLKGCDIPVHEPTCCTTIIHKFKTDNEVDFVSGPFYSDRRHLYEGYEDPSTFFRSALRSFLVHHILINLDMSKKLSTHKIKRNQTIEERRQVDHAKNDIVSRIGLPYLLMKKFYKDSFIPHDISADDPHYLQLKKKSLETYYARVPKLKTDARQELNQTWTKATKFQPLWKIRNYFGEEISMYFAWQGTLITMLWIPAVLGLISFGYGLFLSLNHQLCYTVNKNGSKFSIHDSKVNKSDPNIFCPTGLSGLKEAPHDALDYFRNTFDNKLTPFVSLMICIWSALFIEVWRRTNATLSYEWDCDVYEDAEPDRPEFVGTDQILDPLTKQMTWIYPSSKRIKKYLASSLVVLFMILIVFMSVCTVTIVKVSLRDRFNCSNEDGTVDVNEENEGSASCLLGVTIIPTVLNSVSILILGYFYDIVARKLTIWENHRTSSEHKDALIIKLFAFQFVNTYTSLFYIAFFRPEEHGMQPNGLFNMGKRYSDTCQRGGCMSLLSLQVLSLMILKPLTKLLMDIFWPWLKSNYYKLKQFLFQNQVDDEAIMKSSRPPSSSTTEAAVTNENIFIREYLKPKLRDFTLNEYSEKVIEFGYIVMFAASFPVAPLILLIISLFDLRIDAKRLLWFNRRPVAFISTDIGMWYPILRFVSFCGVISNAFIVAFTSSFCQDFFEVDDVSTSQRLYVVLVFEHVVFVIMYILSVVIPSTPANIRLAQRRERYEVVQILENQKHPNHICKCQQNGSGHGKDGLWLPTTRESTMMESPQDSETTRSSITATTTAVEKKIQWTNPLASDPHRASTASVEEEQFNLADDRWNLMKTARALKKPKPTSIDELDR